MPQIDEFVSVSEAKNKLLDLIRRVKHRQEVVAITRDGVPSAVLLSMDQFEGPMETIEIINDQKAMRRLRRSLRQAEKGQWASHEAVFGRDTPSTTQFDLSLSLCQIRGHQLIYRLAYVNTWRASERA